MAVKNKGLDETVVDLDDRFSRAENVLNAKKTSLPSISPKAKPAAGSERRSSAVSLPDYVWELLRVEAFERREPGNVIIMRGLKALGLDIREEDLIDPRKTRNKE